MTVLASLLFYTACGIGLALVALAITKHAPAERQLLLRVAGITGSLMLLFGLGAVVASEMTVAAELSGKRSLLGLAIAFLLAAGVVKARQLARD